MYAGLVIADDLTGATDTGQQFAADGYRTVVTSWPVSEAVSADVLVVETDTRTESPEEASRIVGDVAGTFSARVVYKKIDSTIRGNVAAEVEAVFDRSDSDIALVAPAFPAADRATVGGYHLVDGSPVESSGDYKDETPPPTSNLVELFAETDYSVAHVPIDVIAQGADAITDALASVRAPAEQTIVVCDAVRNSHLASIATAGERTDVSLYVGSAGLASHITPPGEARERNSLLGVVGSTNQRTLEQLSALPDEHVVALDCETAVVKPREAGQATALRAAERIEESGVAVVTSVGSMSSVDRAYEVGAKHGLERTEVRERIGTALTTAVEACWAETTPDGLFLTGGTVAKGVLAALGVDSITLTGRAVEDGVPIARFETDDGEESLLVTKAGGFGGPETIRRCLDRLRRS